MLIIGTAALLFFGPDQLPKVARRAGQVVREVQATSQSFIREMELAADEPSASAYGAHPPYAPETFRHEPYAPDPNVDGAASEPYATPYAAETELNLPPWDEAESRQPPPPPREDGRALRPRAPGTAGYEGTLKDPPI